MIIDNESSYNELNASGAVETVNTSKMINDIVELEGTYYVYPITSPIDSMSDLLGLCGMSPNKTIALYLVVDTYTDNKRSNSYIRMGDLTLMDDNNPVTWSFKVDDKLSPKYVDITMYTKCWRTADDNTIRDFINDIFYKYININKGKDSTSGINKLIQQRHNPVVDESIDNKSSNDEDTTTYEIEYNPDDIIVYIHENYDDEDDLSEDTEEDRDDKIKSFFESIFDVDNSEIIPVNENLSKIIVKVGAQYLLGKGALALLKNITKNIRRNPFTK